jgi:transposase
MPDAMHSASGFDRIEVVTVERRRRWSLGEKLKAVEESDRFPAYFRPYLAPY